MSEIAQLSGAIDRQRSLIAGQPEHRDVHGSRPARAAQVRGRGRARGRGLGYGSIPRHRSLVLSRDPKDEWVHRRSKKSMTLVNSAVYEPPKEHRFRAEAPSMHRGHRSEVVVDGVPFVFDESGTKLVKKSTLGANASSSVMVTPTAASAATGESADTSASVTQAPPPTPTIPRQTSINGQAFVRTKNGNLINKALVLERREARARHERMQRLAKLGQKLGHAHKQQRALERAKTPQLCTYYTRTGTCRRGTQCPFIHDDQRKALCPGVLKPSGCVLPPGTCLLSHTRCPQNVPHCVHFLRLHSCRNGDACPFTHAQVAHDAPVCRAFALLGWCDQGDKCLHRHAKECPDFTAKGTCTDPACRLAHVSIPPRLEPSASSIDTPLFVRDDAGAEEERYFDGDHNEEDNTEHLNALYVGDELSDTDAASAQQPFSQQRDFIGLDDMDFSDVSETSSDNVNTEEHGSGREQDEDDNGGDDDEDDEEDGETERDDAEVDEFLGMK